MADAAEATERGVHTLHVLYRSYNAVARSRGLGDVLHALIDHLAAFAEPDRTDEVQVEAGVVVAEGGVVLIPLRVLRWEPMELGTQLRRQGLALSSMAAVRLDLDTGRLVVPEPALTLDRAPLEELGAATGGPGWLPPGAHPVLGWVLPAPGAESLSRAAAVAIAARAVTNPATVGAGPMLRGLAAVLSAVPAVPVAESWRAAEVSQAVAAVLAARAGATTGA
ncbi:MAG TPA: hypothetical protein VFO65_01140 [Acidimicrobiales bacterium]|nr:hypothetical protein [Acidimicrobiales bacterium]